MATKKKKILVITGTRAEFGYLRPVLKEIQKSKALSLKLLVTGMHTLKNLGNTQALVAQEFAVAATVPVGKHDTMVEALAKEVVGIENYCLKDRPDLMLVIGDRDEALAGAIVAGHLGIALAHLSAGSTSGFGVDEPIRHSITKFAHIHFAWTKNNGKRLVAMGEEPWRVHVSGSTAFDTLAQVPLLSRGQLAKALNLNSKKPWLLLVQHPTPLDRTPLKEQLKPTLAAIQKIDAEHVVVYPNSDTGSREFVAALEKLKGRNIHLYKSLPHQIFLSLLKHSQVLVGNSSSGIEEAGYFHLPVVNIGERQKGREHGANVLHVPYEAAAIEKAIHKALSLQFVQQTKKATHPYYFGNASKKIVKVLEQLELNQKLRYKQIPVK